MNIELNYSQASTLRAMLAHDIEQLNQLLEQTNLGAEFEGTMTMIRDEKEELYNIMIKTIDQWLGLS